MGGAAVEQVVLFIYRGDRCAQLVRDVHEALRSSGRQAKLRVVTAGISDPREFPSFLTLLGELYGRQYVEEFEKHQIRSLPALVAGSVKLFEGRFPSREELAELLGGPRAEAPARPLERQVAEACRGCLFYDAQTSRCLLLRALVRDARAPPCGKKR